MLAYVLHALTMIEGAGLIQSRQVCIGKAWHSIRSGVCFHNGTGPQYASEEMAKFARKYNFTYITSSPCYPQGNGFTEH